MTGSRTFASPRTAVATAFFVHAMITGSFAGRVPAIKHGLGVTDAQLGVALFAAALGTLIGGRVGGVLAARFGPRRMVRLGMPVVAALLVATALAGSLAVIAVVLLVYGIVAASVDVCTNAEAVVVEREHGRPLMSGFHGMWSTGLLAGGAVAIAGGGGRSQPDRALRAGRRRGRSWSRRRCWRGCRGASRRRPSASRADRWSGAVIVLGLIAFCSFFAEGAAADWSAVYLHDRAGAGPALAAAAFASFSLAMAASRLAGDALGAARRAGAAGPRRQPRLGRRPRAGPARAGARRRPGRLRPARASAWGPVVPTVISAAGRCARWAPPRASSRASSRWATPAPSIGPAVIGFAAGQVGLRAALVIPRRCWCWRSHWSPAG